MGKALLENAKQFGVDPSGGKPIIFEAGKAINSEAELQKLRISSTDLLEPTTEAGHNPIKD